MATGTRRKVTAIVLRLLVLSLLCYLMLRWFEYYQVYHPEKALAATGAELGRPFEDVLFRTSDDLELHGWFFPAEAGSPRAHLAILLCHGNAGNISHRLDVCETFLRKGLNVFNFDYRGYGRSRGRPGEEGTYRDAQAAYRWLRQRGFAGEHIIAFGESLGGGVASELALRETLGGVILLSSFSSTVDLGAELFPWLPVRRLATIKYDTQSKLPRITVPVMVMHSRGDELIGFQHAERNFAAANEPKVLWEIPGDHNSAYMETERFSQGLDKFFTMLEGAKPPSREAKPEAGISARGS